MVVKQDEGAPDLAFGLVGPDSRGHLDLPEALFIRHGHGEGVRADVEALEAHRHGASGKGQGHGHALGRAGPEGGEGGDIEVQPDGIGSLLGGKPAVFDVGDGEQGLPARFGIREEGQQKEHKGDSGHRRGVEGKLGPIGARAPNDDKCHSTPSSAPRPSRTTSASPEVQSMTVEASRWPSPPLTTAST